MEGRHMAAGSKAGLTVSVISRPLSVRYSSGSSCSKFSSRYPLRLLFEITQRQLKFWPGGTAVILFSAAAVLSELTK